MFKCIEAGESGWEEFKLVSLVIRECQVNDEPDKKKKKQLIHIHSWPK